MAQCRMQNKGELIFDKGLQSFLAETKGWRELLQDSQLLIEGGDDFAVGTLQFLFFSLVCTKFSKIIL